MPKSKRVLPDRRTASMRVKFKMGGRKSTVSGLTMTDDELLKIEADKSAGRKRPLATQILNSRGVARAA